MCYFFEASWKTNSNSRQLNVNKRLVIREINKRKINILSHALETGFQSDKIKCYLGK